MVCMHSGWISRENLKSKTQLAHELIIRVIASAHGETSIWRYMEMGIHNNNNKPSDNKEKVE